MILQMNFYCFYTGRNSCIYWTRQSEIYESICTVVERVQVRGARYKYNIIKYSIKINIYFEIC